MKGCGKVQEIHVETNDVRILVGSQHRIIIDKLYGPTCVPNLVITWDGDDWNVRKANARLRSALRSCQKKETSECEYCHAQIIGNARYCDPMCYKLHRQETGSAVGLTAPIDSTCKSGGLESRPDTHSPKASLSMGTSSGKVLGYVDD